MKARKIIALVLALLMVSSLFAGCGKEEPAAPTEPAAPAAPADPAAPAEPADPAAFEQQSFYIGTNTWGAGVPIVDMIGDSRQYTLELFSSEVNRSSDDFTADKELQNGQNMIAAGVDGICFQGGAPNVVVQIAALAAENKTPITFDTQIGTEDILADLQANNPYYLGAIDLNNVMGGAQLAERAYNDGCRTAIIIGGNIGDTNMDDRSKGFTTKFEELGGTVLAEGRCTDQSECATKMEDMLSANRDVDCIYAMVGDYVAGSISAMQNIGVTPNFYLSNIDGDSAKYIQEGVITAGNDGTLLPPILAATLMINYLNGNQILDDNGKAPRLQTNPTLIDKANVDLYIEVFCSTDHQPMSDDLIKSLVYPYNPDASYATYQDVIANQLTLDNLAAGLGIG